MRFIPLLSALALLGCSPELDPAAVPDIDGDALARTAAQLTSAGFVFGEIDSSAADLSGSGTLAAATRVDVFVTSGASGFARVARDRVNSQGRFAARIGAQALADADAIVVVARDQGNNIIGAMVTEAARLRTEVFATHRMTTETSFEALVYVRARARSGAQRAIDQVDIRNRIDAALVASVQAAGSGYAYMEDEADAMADAAVAAQATLAAKLQASGSTAASEAARIRAAAEADARAAVSSSTSLAAEIDGLYASYGVDAQDRADAYAAAEAAFRAMIEAGATTSASAQDDAESASAELESSLRAEASAALTTASQAESDFRDDMTATMANLYAQLAAASDTTFQLVTDYRSDAEADADATVEATLVANPSLIGDVAVDMGLAAGLSASETSDAMWQEARDIGITFAGDAAAEASAAIAAASSSGGAIDADAFATAMVDLFAQARTETRDVYDELDSEIDADLTATLILGAATCFSSVDD